MAILGVNNKNLFSNHYLENFIQKISEWKLDEHEAAFDEIKELYESAKPNVKNFSEAQLSTNFFEKVFGALNIDFIPQAKTEGQEFPDYAFYPDKESMNRAYSENNTISKECMSICEVKKWDVRLDKRESSKKVRLGDPSHQIFNYLAKTEKPWGVLSNGHKWRIFKHGKYMDIFYEIDLVQILDKNDKDAFKYFYYFFRREAFIKPENEDIFLERIFKGSVDFAKALGDDLKDKVYQAMKILADGFLENSENKLDKNNPEHLTSVQQSTMRLLYRILFLLYAEGKGLLDTNNPEYLNKNSLHRIQKGIIENDKEELVRLWYSLRYLFILINKGSEAFGIKPKDLYIPPYNGGLFSPEKNPNLEEWEISDEHIKKSISLLSLDSEKKGMIDYSSLDIRHLGSIYEGLLEFKLKITDKDLVASGGKSKVWVALEEHNKGKKKQADFNTDFNEFERVKAGDVYLATDNGERKATGSYYTPDYIVEYIVENTVGPVVEEKWKEAEKNNASYVMATLSINVLDPAMGSGHFLVGATEFLATKLMDAVDLDIEAGLLEPIEEYNPHWAKREVVSHCIYGVDLNEMAVELAKLSLWLTTISKDKPLSFLDHRLKHGNSLIGADLGKLAFHPDAWKRGKTKAGTRLDIARPKAFVKKIIEATNEISAINDDTLENVKNKEKLFAELKESKSYTGIKTLADVFTSIYFGNEIDERRYAALSGYVYDCKDIYASADIKQAQEISQEKTFFHWELEFPEVFFEGGQAKENPGFDAVIGNPPYNVLEEKRDEKYGITDVQYFRSLDNFNQFVSGKINISTLFVGYSYSLTRNNGNLSYIIPLNIIADLSLGKLRRYFFETGSIIKAEAFPNDSMNERVFADAEIPVFIFVSHKGTPTNQFDLRVHNGRKLLPDSPTYSISLQDLINIDKETMSIPLVKSFEWKLLTKLHNVSYLTTIGEITHSNQGEINVASDRDFIDVKSDYLLICGKHVHKYFTDDDINSKDKVSRTIDYENLLVSRGDKPKLQHYKKYRVATQGIKGKNRKRRITASIISPNCFLAHSTNYFFIDKPYDLHYLLAHFNSTVPEWRFKVTSVNNNINNYEINRIPIRRINFTTPEPARKDLTSKGEAFYQEYIKSGNKAILDFIEDCLPKDKDGKFITEKEKSDVVHDILAFLAERMNEMNKEKQKEIKGFLDWLEGYISVSLDDLELKTKLKGYYEDNWDVFKKALEKNNKNIEKDISRREHIEKIKEEFDSSMEKLAPLMKTILDTDGLIDKIVYKLYGLTEEEIEIVEGKN